ncbi:hypothetical protein K413DRAFT_3248 [Clostridium sp. ASBs410]|jgi:hypothetical protein|nr:hypothetical protein K413DRAFT_3248 [Clostridium sp. ASBs410]
MKVNAFRCAYLAITAILASAHVISFDDVETVRQFIYQGVIILLFARIHGPKDTRLFISCLTIL